MKEATGELNMTVITVVAIAAIAALFTVFIFPQIQANIMLQTACSNIDSNGNYTSSSGANGAGQDVNCQNFTCTANYNNKTYSKDCHAS